MYFLFKFKGWKPEEYYNLGDGQKKIVAAFMHEEIDETDEARKG